MDASDLSLRLLAGIEAGWYTGCQAALVDSRGIRAVHAGRESPSEEAADVTDDTLFDLASITKSLVSLALAESLTSGALRLDLPLRNRVPGLRNLPLGNLRPSDLMGHRAGLPPYVEWEREFAPAEDASVRERIVRGEGKAFARRRLLGMTPDPGKPTLYSDIGFFLLQILVEEGLGLILPRLVADSAVTEGAGIRFLPVGCAPPGAVAETGTCGWRGRALRGEVNDPRAYLVGGVAAWAGLFGNAIGLGRVAEKVLSLWRGREGISDSLRSLAAGDGTTRRGGFGFGVMVPGPGPSLGGSLIPPSAFGHLGYTGTSWWIDPEGERALILLTNLTIGREDRGGFNDWRRGLHDLFWKED